MLSYASPLRRGYSDYKIRWPTLRVSPDRSFDEDNLLLPGQSAVLVLADQPHLHEAGIPKQAGGNGHFPTAAVDRFTVLLIATSPKRRSTVLQTFEQLSDPPFRPDLWAFAALGDLTPESILRSPVCYRCDDPSPCALVDL